MENKKTIMGIIIGVFLLVVTLSSINLVSAVFLACFDYGETRDYCSNYKPSETCDNENGCQLCMSEYRESEDCYIHAFINLCNQLPPGCSVFGGGGNVTFDLEPPKLKINSPIQDKVYDSRSVLLDLEVNEKSDIYYLNLNNDRGLWTRVCTDCFSYSNKRSFEEGLNELTFRATDVVGNGAYVNLSFVIDSEEPRIKGTSPTGGFVNTILEVILEEENPVSLKVHYGNNETGMITEDLDLGSDCVEDDDELICEKDVDLSAYDGQDINYWFVVTDIANNTDESKHYTLSVDDSDPVINNPDSFYEIDGKYVYFTLNITEINLDEVGYSYIDSRGRLKEKRMCSKLKDGLCEKKVSFKDGPHDVTVYVIDEAGNSVGEAISFFTDSKKPKISKTEPRRGFADGNFEVQFKEENPESLVLYYGNSINTKKLDIDKDCYLDRKKYYCSTSVNLSAYDGGQIEYWFNLTDIVNNTAESRHYELDVDTTFPVINNPGSFFTVDGRYVYFDINITEENFEEVTYSYSDDGRIRSGTLCSRLDDGICEKRKSFSEGKYKLTIQVTDEAGNAIAVPADFDIKI